MPKVYRAYLPEQDLLLPPSLRDWLPEGHLAYYVSDVVDHWIYRQFTRCMRRRCAGNLPMTRG